MSPGDLSAAERYAAALFEIGRNIKQDLEMAEELESLSAALRRSGVFEKFLKSPRYKVEDKRRCLQRIYQERRHAVYGILLNFFTILLQKGRFHLIHEITAAFRRIADADRGLGTAEIRMAFPLAAEAERRIVSRLEKIAGYKIKVKKELDPSLLGGLVVKIRNKVLDGSVQHQIRQLKKELTEIRTV